KDYIVSYPRAEVGDSPHEIRIAASLPGTRVHFEPGIAPDTVIEPGAPLTLSDVKVDVAVQADKPVLIAQYMPGSTSLPVPVSSGDPSQSLAIPSAQFRNNYVFIAEHTYFVNFVNVIVRTNAAGTVALDGANVPGSEFAPVGSSGYSVARHVL